MTKEEMFELYKDDFVRELVNEYQDGNISSWDEIEESVKEYSIENGFDYDEVDLLLSKELERQHIFER